MCPSLKSHDCDIELPITCSGYTRKQGVAAGRTAGTNIQQPLTDKKDAATLMGHSHFARARPAQNVTYLDSHGNPREGTGGSLH